MSSGFGIRTKQGRCYPFWNEVVRCRAQPDASVEACRIYVEDYLECLFHKKEKAKMIEAIRAIEEHGNIEEQGKNVEQVKDVDNNVNK